jgi:hypothetical protein
MAWFVVTDGAPPEPSYDDLLAGRDQPQPHSFLKRLFKELTGTALSASKELVREKESYVETARGYSGNRKVGCAWSASIPVNDTSLPVDETYVTYGLPSATLIWSVAYRKRGQLGYATWTLNYLNARLDGDARDVMERVWTDTFGVSPVFEPAPPEHEQMYVNYAREHEEQFRADLRSTR